MIQIKFRIDHSHYFFFTASTCKAHAALTSNKKKMHMNNNIKYNIYMCVYARAYTKNFTIFNN